MPLARRRRSRRRRARVPAHGWRSRSADLRRRELHAGAARGLPDRRAARGVLARAAELGLGTLRRQRRRQPRWHAHRRDGLPRVRAIARRDRASARDRRVRGTIEGVTSSKWVCIHGHFYQPPRENPWREAIEPQPSAHPYRDWNERITAECYRPNLAARVVDNHNQIIRIVDNYQRMSFNVGPTLMSWLEDQAPDVHEAVIAADRASCVRFGGHGSAMAQAYNHLIMPLASGRDRATQVRWGIADFQRRFGRAPEGMWLPECAVDTPSLESLAAEGIAFAVLAPHQAKAWRPPGGAWRTQPLDTGRAYRCALPSGRAIDLF